MWPNACIGDYLTASLDYIFGTVLFNRSIGNWPCPQLNMPQTITQVSVSPSRLVQQIKKYEKYKRKVDMKHVEARKTWNSQNFHKIISTHLLLSQRGFCLTSQSAVSAYLWAFLGFYDFILTRQKSSFYKKLVSISREIPFLATVYQYHKLKN